MMKSQKNPDETGLADMPTRRLLSRRRALAARLGGAEQVLSGSLTEQTRRCGKPGCRCAGGEPHGPYAFFAPKTAARGRLRYVPASLAGVVRRYLRNGEEIEQLLAEISAINAELLARRELSSPVSAAVLSGPARAEAVAALANMTAAALRSGAGGCGERRIQDHEFHRERAALIYLQAPQPVRQRQHPLLRGAGRCEPCSADAGDYEAGRPPADQSPRWRARPPAARQRRRQNPHHRIAGSTHPEPGTRRSAPDRCGGS